MFFRFLSLKLSASIVLVVFLIRSAAGLNSKIDLLRQTKLPPCRACKVFVDSFIKAMDRTKRNKFDGGDAAWEESKLSSYANSEIRLAEIQELLCTDVEEGREQCYSNNEVWEVYVEEWWPRHSSNLPLQEALCIRAAAVCCQAEQYGPECLPCADCGEHGRCAGAGTRKGNGQCHCDSGYSGSFCETCAPAHYESYSNSRSMFLCSPCHRACAGNCTGAGPSACDACADGWRLLSNSRECTDIDECAEASPKRRCKLNQWCVNNEGSYECLACDAACAGCTGDGPDLCIRCGEGYEVSGEMCVDAHGEGRRRWVIVTRYLTYLGLCLTTCIVLQRSVWAAAVIGLAVAMYISVSEYVILNSPSPLGTVTPNTTSTQPDQLITQTPSAL